MKARVKATGEIVDVKPEPYIANDRWDIGIRFTDNDDNIYREYQLDFEDLTQGKVDVKEKSFPKDEPDYWEKLKHQYAGKFLQGMIIGKPFTRDYVKDAYDYATALVNRLKEEEK